MTTAPLHESFGLHTDDGLVLEAVLDAPEPRRAALVLCHPHPKMGGTMNAPLLEALRDDFVARGWAVIRFNFRGIGASQGEASTGTDEVADARAAVAEARRRWSDLPVAVTGWSFGAGVALRLSAEDADLAACVAIAPAVAGRPGVTAGLPDPGAMEISVPTLFVLGANDDVAPPGDAREWAEAAGIRVVEMAGANHFFWGKYEALADEIGRFLGDRLS